MDQDLTAGLDALVSIARDQFGDQLRSVVLFGSGAEDRLRVVSDLNLILVLHSYDLERAAGFGQQSAPQRAALQAHCMFILDAEVAEAGRAFAVKFSDISRRHRVLWGEEVFANLVIPRGDRIHDLREGLFDLDLRLRARWVASGASPDLLRRSAAEFAGGLRACAAELLSLEGTPAPSAREALERIAGQPLAELSAARTNTLAAAEAEQLFRQLLGLATVMRSRAGAVA